MKGYKAFGKGMVCNGKQYAENTVFEEEKAKVCECGMHFCENPLDVLDYYPLVDNNGELTEFAEVEALDEVLTDDNKKYCTKKLKVGAKLDLPAFVKASIDFQFEKTPVEKTIKKCKNSSGDSAKCVSSGNFAKCVSSGDFAQCVSSGDFAQCVSSGDFAKCVSSGNFAKCVSSGNSAKCVSSGDFAQCVSSGNSAKCVSSGNFAKCVSSGNFAKCVSSGDFAQCVSSGNSSIIAGVGVNNIAKAVKGCWITLAEWKYDENKNRYIPVCVKTEYVDGKKIKENVFYKLVNGEFTEVEE